jgi:hypothetical protein
MIIKIITIQWYNFFYSGVSENIFECKKWIYPTEIFLIFSYLHISHRLENLLYDTHLAVLSICVKILDGVHA